MKDITIELVDLHKWSIDVEFLPVRAPEWPHHILGSSPHLSFITVLADEEAINSWGLSARELLDAWERTFNFIFPDDYPGSTSFRKDYKVNTINYDPYTRLSEVQFVYYVEEEVAIVMRFWDEYYSTRVEHERKRNE